MTVVVYVAIALLALPTLWFVVEILAALPADGAAPPSAPAPAAASAAASRRRVAVLVPAHDEEAGIAATLATIAPALAAGDRLLVVADNCADATAAVARAAGAEVVERRDEARRGKSYALAAGVAALAADPPDVVVIVDADCRVAPGAIDRLRAAAVERPAQAAYVMHAPDGAPAPRRLAEALFAIRNVARPLGLVRLGLPCLLTGSGMALPWSCLARVRLDSGSVVEDVQLAVDLACAGVPPRFCPGARVTSVFPTGATAAAAQATRWTWGTLRTLRQAPRLAAAAVRLGRPSLLGLALELAVPPLALLFPLWTLLVAAGAAIGLTNRGWAPLALAAALAAAAALAVVLGWWRVARRRVPASVLLGAPLYALPAMAAMLRGLLRRRQRWERTRRD